MVSSYKCIRESRELIKKSILRIQHWYAVSYYNKIHANWIRWKTIIRPFIFSTFHSFFIRFTSSLFIVFFQSDSVAIYDKCRLKWHVQGALNAFKRTKTPIIHTNPLYIPSNAKVSSYIIYSIWNNTLNTIRYKCGSFPVVKN